MCLARKVKRFGKAKVGIFFQNQNLNEAMMVSQTDLILNADGSVYHLNLLPEDISDLIITVGDPDRVAVVSKHFDEILVKKRKREFITHTGRVGKRKVTVISTGIGTDNVDIVMNELDALVNTDFQKRIVKKELKVLKIIRIGTSGTLSEDIETDTVLASRAGLGLDTLGAYYQFGQTEHEKTFCDALRTGLRLDFQPYLKQGAEDLRACFSEFRSGITASCPGFYAPQGRQVRAEVKNRRFLEEIADFRFHGEAISNFEMETSAYYAIGDLLGHKCLSLNAIVANRTKKVFSKDPYAVIENLTRKVIEKISENDFFA
jgi:uridine phosphorylase